MWPLKVSGFVVFGSPIFFFDFFFANRLKTRGDLRAQTSLKKRVPFQNAKAACTLRPELRRVQPLRSARGPPVEVVGKIGEI